MVSRKKYDETDFAIVFFFAMCLLFIFLPSLPAASSDVSEGGDVVHPFLQHQYGRTAEDVLVEIDNGPYKNLFWTQIAFILHSEMSPAEAKGAVMEGEIMVMLCPQVLYTTGVRNGELHVFKRTRYEREMCAYFVRKTETQEYLVSLFSLLCGNPNADIFVKKIKRNAECVWRHRTQQSIESHGGLGVSGDGEFLVGIGGGLMFNLGSTEVFLPRRSWNSSLIEYSCE